MKTSTLSKYKSIQDRADNIIKEFPNVVEFIKSHYVEKELPINEIKTLTLKKHNVLVRSDIITVIMQKVGVPIRTREDLGVIMSNWFKAKNIKSGKHAKL